MTLHCEGYGRLTWEYQNTVLMGLVQLHAYSIKHAEKEYGSSIIIRNFDRSKRGFYTCSNNDPNNPAKKIILVTSGK